MSQVGRRQRKAALRQQRARQPLHINLQVHYARRLLKPVLAQSYAVLPYVPTHILRPLFIGGPLHLSVRQGLGVDLRTLTTNSLGLAPFYSSLYRCIPRVIMVYLI